MSNYGNLETLPDSLKTLIQNPNLIDDELARRNFSHYRRVMRPKMLHGWLTDEVERELQQFYHDVIAGKRPMLALFLPPQHGKSWAVADGLSWMSGHNPDLRVIYTSFSGRLSVRANLMLQRMYMTDRYKRIFPNTQINERNVVTLAGEYQRNREIIEYIGHEGYFRNTTVGGPITGESLDIGVMDDPLKGSKEARSKTVRDSVWDWLTEDFFSRFSDHAGMLMICTRWHLDDPAGRLITEFPDMRIVHYPAIAEQDEEHRKEGEPLFPELKPLEYLLKRKQIMTSSRWQAVYQQSPVHEGGNLIKVNNMEIIPAAPTKVKKRVRYWDKAGSQGHGDYTAGVLMAQTMDNQFVIEDVIRGQWTSLERERRIKQAAETDGKCDIWIEQEPGSSGKESAEATIRNLAGYNVRADKVTGSKTDRAEPYAAQVEGGNVKLVKGAWNKAFIDENEQFPNGTNDDQVDAAAGAFAKLTGKRKVAQAL